MISWHINLYFRDSTPNGIVCLHMERLSMSSCPREIILTLYIPPKKIRQYPKNFHQFSILKDTLEFIIPGGIYIFTQILQLKKKSINYSVSWL